MANEQLGRFIRFRWRALGSEGDFKTPAFVTTKSISINNETIDTTSDDASGWSQFSQYVGKKTIELSIEGNLSDDRATIGDSLFNVAFSGGLCDTSSAKIEAEILFYASCPNAATPPAPEYSISGSFVVGSYEISGETSAVATYSCSLTSDGEAELSITPPPEP
jgi:predicted secreted protein